MAPPPGSALVGGAFSWLPCLGSGAPLAMVWTQSLPPIPISPVEMGWIFKRWY